MEAHGILVYDGAVILHSRSLGISITHPIALNFGESTMTTKQRTLDDFRGPSPCSIAWSDMTGNERVRHCGVCHENVVNLSAFSRAEAEQVLANPTVKCVHILRRDDETPIFLEQPSLKTRIARLFSWVSAGLLLALGTGCSEMVRSPEKSPASEGANSRDPSQVKFEQAKEHLEKAETSFKHVIVANERIMEKLFPEPFIGKKYIPDGQQTLNKMHRKRK